jgi:putative membrane protein
MSAAPLPGRQPGQLPGQRAAEGSPMNADDSAKLRDLLANNRTLLAYIRTALAFAGLGFAVAKFGLTPKTHVSGYIGTFMVLVGLVVTISGFAQHRAVAHTIEPLPPGLPATWRSFHVAAAIGCTLVCALLAIYLAANAT